MFHSETMTTHLRNYILQHTPLKIAYWDWNNNKSSTDSTVIHNVLYKDIIKTLNIPNQILPKSNIIIHFTQQHIIWFFKYNDSIATDQPDEIRVFDKENCNTNNYNILINLINNKDIKSALLYLNYNNNIISYTAKSIINNIPIQTYNISNNQLNKIWLE